MAKLIWFVAILLSLGAVMMLGGYKGIPVDNERFAVKEEKRIAAEKMALEEEKKRELERLKAIEDAKKPTLVLDTPELKRGHELYHKKAKCITCHGKDGEGKSSQQAPKVAGQHDWYIVSSLQKFQSGERVNPKMMPYLRGLTLQDYKDIAEYLSKLPPK